MTEKRVDLILRTLALDETLAQGREFVQGGVLSETKYEAIQAAVHDFQDAIVARLAGTMDADELRARADLVLELMRP